MYYNCVRNFSARTMRTDFYCGFYLLLAMGIPVCSSSCEDGYYLSEKGLCKPCPKHCVFCESEDYCLYCETGYAGNVCEIYCSNCLPGTNCERKTGFCTEACRDGLSGVLCDTICDEKCESCYRENPSLCRNCTHNRYGDSCNKICPSACRGNTCNDQNGVCTSGCESRYWGNTCNNTCPISCLDNACSDQDGECNSGCKDGFWGRLCQHHCADACQEPSCLRDSGTCLIACEQETCNCFRYCDCDTDARCTNCSTSNETVCGRNCSEKCSESFCSRQTGQCYKDCLNATEKLLCKQDPGATSDDNDEKYTYIFLGLAAVLFIPEAAAILYLLYLLVKGSKKRTKQKEEYLFPMNKLSQTIIENNWQLLESSKKQVEDSLQVTTLKTRMTELFKKSKREKKSCTEESSHEVTIELLTETYTDSSFNKGLDGSKGTYIACKGPTTQLMTEFWKMIWKGISKTIVMLTGPNETEECLDRYWPEEGAKEIYGDIRVACDSKEDHDTYIRRVLIIATDDGGRVIQHFQFTDWSAVKKTTALKPLLDFQKNVRLSNDDGPLLVHCSDGCSRTGTYIALDILMTCGQNCGRADLNSVYRCVRALRQQRENMVGSLEQYTMLHHALDESVNEEHVILMTEQVSRNDETDQPNHHQKTRPAENQKQPSTDPKQTDRQPGRQSTTGEPTLSQRSTDQKDHLQTSENPFMSGIVNPKDPKAGDNLTADDKQQHNKSRDKQKAYKKNKKGSKKVS